MMKKPIKLPPGTPGESDVIKNDAPEVLFVKERTKGMTVEEARAYVRAKEAQLLEAEEKKAQEAKEAAEREQAGD